MSLPPRTIKCVLIGDDNAGKTSLMHTYASGRRPSPSSSCLESLSKMVHVTAHHLNATYELQLFDTLSGAGQLRSRLTAYSAYRDTDCALLCADLTEPSSWRRLEADWKAELDTHLAGVPLVVAGTKAEARDAIEASDAGAGEAMGSERGRRVAARLGAAAYRECSTVTGDGVAAVFADVLEAALHPQRRLPTRPLSVRDLWDKFTAR
ncbi:rac-like GTP-binding protein 2 [Amphibalanus amphitrite]|uniref:rac-like GTP-binding protein 2 n=1 Tax=Amphibalanus amphitrite TaxID=1232801 RepID=UPI001C924063|nr:rac-like GTP-binding protein 2 [Amphibalanus amphitrite]